MIAKRQFPSDMFRWLCCLLGLPWYSRPTPANIEEMPGRDVQVLIIGASPPEKSVTVDKDVETVRDFWTKRCGSECKHINFDLC